MEKILHQFANGLSQYSPIIYSECFIVVNSCQLLQDFFLPPYVLKQMQWSRIESIHIWEGIRKTEASGTTVTRKHADCGAKINSKPLWQDRC